ncbi:hypothetical protein EKN06_01065 [Croceicoccus ponticola]|uniref:Uncharacterized protein n=1 Tax=Croceicoccus ponticola TaxID=2217664 RepID=A0A437GZS5_9SPHN|nr:hypothetical protein [Croceicoccus ponticola]RVQ68850.1 hypothetical protein EKN06_01065 [Croceicoccus ponticola]
MSHHPDPFPFTPVERAAHARLTPARQRDFIAALAETGLVAVAALRIGVSVAALEKLRYAKGAGEFRAAWDAARGCERAKAARKGARGLSRGDAGFGGPGWGDAGCGDWVGMEGAGLQGVARLACKSARPSRRTSYLAFAAEPPAPGDPLLGFAPYIHTAPRRNAIVPDRQRAFIAALAATGSVTQAAREIGASLEALYKLRARGGAEGFAKAWDKAVDAGMARLEDSALIRAMEGELRPVVSGGRVIGHYRRHNEALTMFMLRHRRAHRYGSERERSAAQELDEQEIIDSINRKLDQMRERMGFGKTVGGKSKADGDRIARDERAG